MVKTKKENTRKSTAGDEFEIDFCAKHNAHRMPVGFEGYDAVLADGTTVELKSFRGNHPSVGGPKLIATERNVRTIVTAYMALADYLVIEHHDRTEQWLTKAEAIEHLMLHVALTSESHKRSGGKRKLRLMKTPRTPSATAKLLAAGFTL